MAPLIGTYALGATGMDGHQWTSHVLSRSPFTAVFNAAGFPAMSLPLFTDDPSDLPIGMQFVAPAGREDVLFRVAGQLERALPWADRTARIWAGSMKEADVHDEVDEPRFD
jgi:amidase